MISSLFFSIESKRPRISKPEIVKKATDSLQRRNLYIYYDFKYILKLYTHLIASREAREEGKTSKHRRKYLTCFSCRSCLSPSISLYLHSCIHDSNIFFNRLKRMQNGTFLYFSKQLCNDRLTAKQNCQADDNIPLE